MPTYHIYRDSTDTTPLTLEADAAHLNPDGSLCFYKDGHLIQAINGVHWMHLTREEEDDEDKTK